MKKTFKYSTLLVASSSLMTMFSASAANTFYQAGDLILYFQRLSGSSITNTVYVDLGPATDYRGAAIGCDLPSPTTHIMNLNDTFTAAFGGGWASDAGLYAGIAGVYQADNSNAVTHGDIARTLYVSSARYSVGTIGDANSNAWELTNTSPFTTGAGFIQQQNNVFGDASGANGYNAQQVISNPTVSLVDDNNPLSVVNSILVIGPSFEVFDGGVEQAGSASNFGDYGDAGTAEFALDLYRLVPNNGRPGEIDGIINGATRTGSFEGTFVLNSAGSLSFVPEPSSLALTGIAAGAFIFRRRRSA